MGFEDVLKKYFGRVYKEVEFVQMTYNALKKYEFADDNTIASVCICRDEISQSLRSIIKHMWGEAFNLSSLGGMFTAGKTGLKAAIHHAPVQNGKERYVFYALPHIAVDSGGHLGVCKRIGRDEESIACGALNAFQKEMTGGKIDLLLDNEDIEQSLLKMRLIKEIVYGHVPDLLELTKVTQAAIQTDIEHTLAKVVDVAISDYAVVTGIQIHGPDANYIWPASCYAIVNGIRQEINLSEIVKSE